MTMQKGSMLRNLAADQRGTSAVEYGLILALIVLILFAALQGMAGETIRFWTHVESEAAKAHAGS
jgi:pilus assembly protein Flp/PilA